MYGESDPTFNENSKFGTATLKFIGNDQKLTTPADANLNIGTTFTIDFWMRFDPYYVNNGLGTNGGAKIISNHSGGECCFLQADLHKLGDSFVPGNACPFLDI